MADINNIPLPPAFEEKESIPISPNDEKDPCQIEFGRFLEERVKLNKQYPDLYQRFEKLGYDDVRSIVDIDNEVLKEEIGLKSLHCKAFIRKIKVFESEANIFREWLKKIVSGNQQYSSMDGLIDRLENKGILTFEALYRYVFNKDDLINIIGREFSKISHILWSEIEKQQNDLITSPTPNPAFSSQCTQSIESMQSSTPIIQNNNDEGTNEGNVTNYIDQ